MVDRRGCGSLTAAALDRIFVLGADVLTIEFEALTGQPRTVLDVLTRLCRTQPVETVAGAPVNRAEQARFAPLAAAAKLAAWGLRAIGARHLLQVLKEDRRHAAVRAASERLGEGFWLARGACDAPGRGLMALHATCSSGSSQFPWRQWIPAYAGGSKQGIYNRLFATDSDRLCPAESRLGNMAAREVHLSRNPVVPKFRGQPMHAHLPPDRQPAIAGPGARAGAAGGARETVRDGRPQLDGTAGSHGGRPGKRQPDLGNGFSGGLACVCRRSCSGCKRFVGLDRLCTGVQAAGPLHARHLRQR